MAYQRILTIQDISCVGQCSLTVALPILSACGHETAVLPSAVLSTHTGRFQGYTFRDLTEDIPAIRRHWESEGLTFAAVYTGYLRSARQIACVRGMRAAAGIVMRAGLREGVGVVSGAGRAGVDMKGKNVTCAGALRLRQTLQLRRDQHALRRLLKFDRSEQVGV